MTDLNKSHAIQGRVCLESGASALGMGRARLHQQRNAQNEVSQC